MHEQYKLNIWDPFFANSQNVHFAVKTLFMSSEATINRQNMFNFCVGGLGFERLSLLYWSFSVLIFTLASIQRWNLHISRIATKNPRFISNCCLSSPQVCKLDGPSKICLQPLRRRPNGVLPKVTFFRQYKRGVTHRPPQTSAAFNATAIAQVFPKRSTFGRSLRSLRSALSALYSLLTVRKTKSVSRHLDTL